MVAVRAAILDRALGLVAYVFRGDLESPRRVWVCLRGDAVTASRAWLGCWSSKAPHDPDLLGLLTSLSERVRTHGKVGPLGTYLSGFHSFPEWDYWGNGTPKPIAHLKPATISAGTVPVPDVEEFPVDDI